MKKICVIGSLNVDLTISLPRFHAPGETISATAFATYTGGKGGNQAVALGRLGADVSMVGMVGDDANGEMYRHLLKKEGVDASMVGVSAQPTGVALIEVETATGNNRIAVNAGANDDLSVESVQGLDLSAFDIFLFQLETPLETMNYLAAKLRRAGKAVLLDPAPAQPLPDSFLSNVDYVTPNETELMLLTGMPTGTPGQIAAAARALQKRTSAVIAKMGAAGALLVRGDGEVTVPGFPVKAIDTTAAGDSFNAGFALGLAMGMSEIEALTLANAVGGLSTTSMGAQAAMPTLERALALVGEHKSQEAFA